MFSLKWTCSGDLIRVGPFGGGSPQGMGIEPSTQPVSSGSRQIGRKLSSRRRDVNIDHVTVREHPVEIDGLMVYKNMEIQVVPFFLFSDAG